MEHPNTPPGLFYFLEALIAFVITVIVGRLFYEKGVDNGIAKVRREAVRYRHGEWKLDEDGSSEFRWTDYKIKE